MLYEAAWVSPGERFHQHRASCSALTLVPVPARTPIYIYVLLSNKYVLSPTDALERYSVVLGVYLAFRDLPI